jgi:hypothetical protein
VTIVRFSPPDPKISEKEWTDLAIVYATALGWHVSHQRPAMTKGGNWVTAISGHKGYPDLTLAHKRWGQVWIELKSHSGRLDPAQVEWRDIILLGGGRWYLLKPKDFDTLMKILDGQPV